MFAELIQGFVKDKIKDQVSQYLGVTPESADGIVGDAVDSLLGGLAKNTQSTEGASSLLNALDKDHDGSVLDDALEIFQSEDKGTAIVEHILGDKFEKVGDLLGMKNNLDASSGKKVISLLAPLVMGFLGKKKKEQGWDEKQLQQVLGQEKEEIEKDEKKAVFMKVIDMDGDGDIDADDVKAMLEANRA